MIKNFFIQHKSFNCADAVLHMLLIYKSNLSLLSNVTPSSIPFDSILMILMSILFS